MALSTEDFVAAYEQLPVGRQRRLSSILVTGDPVLPDAEPVPVGDIAAVYEDADLDRQEAVTERLALRPPA